MLEVNLHGFTDVPSARWIVNFDLDLTDGLVLGALVAAFCPYLVSVCVCVCSLIYLFSMGVSQWVMRMQLSPSMIRDLLSDQSPFCTTV